MQQIAVVLGESESVCVCVCVQHVTPTQEKDDPTQILERFFLRTPEIE